jgi:hypothetical protein
VQSSASSFNFQYLLFYLRSSSNCLHLLPRLPIISLLLSNFPSITCFRRQFLRKMWPIQLAFLLFIVCVIIMTFYTAALQSHYRRGYAWITQHSTPPHFSIAARTFMTDIHLEWLVDQDRQLHGPQDHLMYTYWIFIYGLSCKYCLCCGKHWCSKTTSEGRWWRCELIWNTPPVIFELVWGSLMKCAAHCVMAQGQT